jgi:hypothetical protein
MEFIPTTDNIPLAACAAQNQPTPVPVVKEHVVIIGVEVFIQIDIRISVILAEGVPGKSTSLPICG